jgi:hypothetical protein
VSGTRRYQERLSVPLWWHACTPIFGVLIGGEMVLTDHPVIAGAVIVGMTLLANLFIWNMGRARIVIDGGRIRAGSWRLPLSQVRGVAALSKQQMRDEMRRRDEAVYRCTAPWINEGILLDVDDPQDVPMWLLSTRHPAALSAALAAESIESGLPVAGRS